MDEYNKRLSIKTNKSKKSSSKTKIHLLCEDNDDEDEIALDSIISEEILLKAINKVMDRLGPE
jgi:hypothetical protein